MAAVARGLRIRVTPQERGSCDVSVKRLETGSFPMPQVTAGDGIEIHRRNWPCSSPASTCEPRGNASGSSSPAESRRVPEIIGTRLA